MNLPSNQDSNENGVILATGGYDNSIRFWSVHTGTHAIRVIPQIEPHINAMEITPDRNFLAVATFQHIKFYDVMCKQTHSILNFEGVTKNVTSVGFNSDGRWMYSGGEDGFCRIWDLKAPGQCQKICQARSSVNTAFLHPNQYEIYFGDQNGSIYIWDLRANKTESILIDNDIAINHLSIEPEGNFLACVDNKGNCYTFSLNLKYANNGNTIKIEPEQRKLKIKAHKKYALKCKFSPDSTLLATTSADQTCKIWRTADLLPLNEKPDNETSLKGSTSSPLNSNWPFTENVSYLCQLSVPNIGWIWDCAFSADSQFIFTASSDGIARLWNVATGEVGREYTGHQRIITSLAFSDQLVD